MSGRPGVAAGRHHERRDVVGGSTIASDLHLLRPPRIFISYAHDSDARRAAVRQLRDVLGSLGFAVILDQDVTGPVNWPEWQERSINAADFVLVIASP